MMPDDRTITVYDRAAEWAERLLSDAPLAGDEQRVLEAWLDADMAHQDALNACLELEGVMDGARGSAWAEALIAEADAELAEDIEPAADAGPAPWRLPGWGPAGIAAAAAVVAIAVALPALMSGPLSPAATDTVAGTQTVAMAAYSTDRGEVRAVPMEDGSIIALNTGTRVETAYTPGERRVTLIDGEALFQVAHDATRPFIVSAGGHEVRAVGTEFNVYTRADGTTLVTVVEGLVQTRTEGGSFSAALLRAGEQVVLVPGEPASAPARVDPGIAVSWRDGMLVFENRDLAGIVSEFQRYVELDVTFADDGLEQLAMSGSFDPQDTEAFLAALERTGSVSVDRNGDQIVLSRAGASSN